MKTIVIDQKTIVGLICLLSILGLVFTGKTDGNTAVEFVKWIAGFYFLAVGSVQATQKYALSKMPMGPIGSSQHNAMMKALGAPLLPTTESAPIEKKASYIPPPMHVKTEKEEKETK
jgi:hypothetical protein